MIKIKELSLEEQIYFCKYHGVDNSLHTTIGIHENEVEPLLKKFKENGLYKKYRYMSDEEYEEVIKKEKSSKKHKSKNVMSDITEKNKKEIIMDNSEPKNKLLDLNELLFKQLKTLMDDSLTQERLDEEIKISKQVVSVSQTIINNANLLLQAKKHFDETKNDNSEIAPLLSLDK